MSKRIIKNVKRSKRGGLLQSVGGWILWGISSIGAIHYGYSIYNEVKNGKIIASEESIIQAMEIKKQSGNEYFDVNKQALEIERNK